MPTYEFRCPNGHEFEKFYRTISGAEAQAVCSVCGLVAGRMMSATGFAFKGSGFYLTDYGKNAHRNEGDLKAVTARKDAAAGGEAAKAESSAPAPSSSPSEGAGAASTTPAETKKAEPKAESKPTPAPAKPSSSE